MTKQIVTGNSLEGQIGNLHEEDIVLDFVGTHPDQLIIDCYYRGSVDGYSDFGVFVNIGDNVTGLLHRSELPGRLESLDWDVGESVYVQVKNVRDNGNVDLGWSLRMSKSEFRGSFVHDPEGKLDPDDLEDVEAKQEPEPESFPADSSTTDVQPSPDQESKTAVVESDSEGSESERPQEAEASADIERAEIAVLDERVGDLVRLEGVITNVRQTGGPTVFTLQDETGTVDCAAFEGAGVRAYPEVDTDDFVRFDGEVRERRGELQIETERLSLLSDEAATTVGDRMEDAIAAEAAVEEVEPLTPDPSVEAVLDGVREAATSIRRAVIESRPIIVRHAATVDGYLSGAAIERAVLPLIENEHTDAEAVYHLFDRRPLDGAYDLNAATNDVTSMLDAYDRHEQKHPLFVFAATGSTSDSLDGFELLRLYDANAIVVDGGIDADEAITDAVNTTVNPRLADETTSATALSTAIAVHINNDVRDDLPHLPAASFWENTPETYVDLAAENDYSTTDTERLRESVALEAYYQSYEDKRELIADLLFEESSGLREQISEQFREKLASEVETAEENIDRRSEGGVAFAVLDTEAFTHRFDFPPTDLLLEEIHRRNRDGTFVTLGVDENEIIIRSTAPIDVDEIAKQVEESVQHAGIAAYDGQNRIEFVIGKRERVIENVVDAIAETI